ncbi:hypothetical protein HBA55_26965 [Pseudomaricurvus alkylphenolicus]|uniref:hypothetical protein n=1 Tax=Pseudomaricurvus alkylphenolicus TaxID=1306991 RepID=UPI001420B2A2|nr:hypothetical protein [Pseudomaricurvus alkylphenolicus]NIB43278.1 hypothetical protein [Pseudomaricurvus alkylphenolicus]
MGICAKELRQFVIQPTLLHLGDDRPCVENLLMGTAAQASGLGFHLTSDNNEGLGIYQIQPQTHIQLWDQYLINDPDLASRIRGLASQHEFLAHPHAELATNLSYATALAWLKYQQAGAVIPDGAGLATLAEIWHRYWCQSETLNPESFINSYRESIEGLQLAANSQKATAA